jgi:hypothetical protein
MFQSFVSRVALVLSVSLSAVACASPEEDVGDAEGATSRSARPAPDAPSAAKKQEVLAMRTLLVSLPQKGEGDDPLNLFKEGLHLENDNWLSVRSESGVLEVDAAGFHFEDGHVDGKLTNSVDVLEYSALKQRYLVTVRWDRQVSYELLVEVDRPKREGTVSVRDAAAPERGWQWVANYAESDPSDGGQ